MKMIFVILVSTFLSFSAKSQSQKPDELKARQLSYLVLGSDTANYWYYKTKTFLLREPSNGYEWRMTMPIRQDKNKLIPKGTQVVKLESTQIDSSKKTLGFFLLLE
jgi:hypothetical protein